MNKNIIRAILFLVLSICLLSPVLAEHTETINFDDFKNIAIPLHIIEIILAFFICYMALKFFRITKPVNLFLFIYTAIGFFFISSLLYLLLYLSTMMSLKIFFVQVYIGSRVALIGMVVSFVLFFYQWNKIMRKQHHK